MALIHQKVKKDKKRKSLPVVFDKEAPKPKVSRKVSAGTFAFKDLNPVEVPILCVYLGEPNLSNT